jgi:hypothetical protein
MADEFSAGDRVEITEDYHWAQGALGTIIQHPMGDLTDSGRALFRTVSAVKGQLRFYWVKFDATHIDADGDGPYSDAEIDGDHLRLYTRA